MRSRNPELMKAIRGYVESYYREHLSSPSIRSISEATGIPRATVQRYLVDMDSRGMLEYSGRVAASPAIAKCTTGYVSAPIVGSIRCGSPEGEEADVEEYVNLPKSVFGGGSMYLLRAKGDSMHDAGIDEGDLVVITVQNEANVGDIVVALDGSGQNTLKRYAGFDASRGCYVLEYMNEKAYPGKAELVDSFTVQGVARHVIKAI